MLLVFKYGEGSAILSQHWNANSLLSISDHWPARGLTDGDSQEEATTPWDIATPLLLLLLLPPSTEES